MQYLKRWLEMDDDMRETCVFLEGEDLEKIAKKGQDQYGYQLESVKQYLFGDEFGFVDEDKKISTADLKDIYVFLVQPMLENYEKFNKYQAHWSRRAGKEIPKAIPELQFLGQAVP